MKLNCLLLCLLLLASSQRAQSDWTQTNGPAGGRVYCLAVNGAYLFAGTWGGGVYRSTDNGTSWTRVSAGLTNTVVLAFAVSGTTLYAGTEGGGVFRSTDNGTTWTAVNSGLSSLFVYSLAVSGANLLAGTNGGACRSTNDGGTWAAVGPTSGAVRAITVIGTDRRPWGTGISGRSPPGERSSSQANGGAASFVPSIRGRPGRRPG